MSAVYFILVYFFQKYLFWSMNACMCFMELWKHAMPLATAVTVVFSSAQTIFSEHFFQDVFGSLPSILFIPSWFMDFEVLTQET